MNNNLYKLNQHQNPDMKSVDSSDNEKSALKYSNNKSALNRENKLLDQIDSENASGPNIDIGQAIPHPDKIFDMQTVREQEQERIHKEQQLYEFMHDQRTVSMNIAYQQHLADQSQQPPFYQQQHQHMAQQHQ